MRIPCWLLIAGKLRTQGVVGIAAWDSATDFEKVEIIPISGEGQRVD